MKELEQEILQNGIIINNEIVKIDSFLNHQINIPLFMNLAKDIKEHFKGQKVDKILTIEASGIALGFAVGLEYGVKNFVFAKKSKSAIVGTNVYQSEVYSFTRKMTSTVTIDKKFVSPGENVLIVDDFLADGQAVHALIDLVHQAGGEVVGIGIAVEKGQQNGGRLLREEGYRLESIAVIEEMDWKTQRIDFRH